MDHNRFRQRLIGAVILVLLAVIFLPMILSGRDDPKLADTIKSRGQGSLKTVVLSLDDRHRVTDVKVIGGERSTPNPAPPATARTVGAPEPVTPAPAQPATAAQTSQAVDVAVSSAPPPTKVEAPTPPPVAESAADEKVTKGWIVQSGSFTSEEHAKKLHADIQKKGLPSLLVKVEKGGEAVYKVRFGPYEDEPSAREMATEVTKAGFNAKVLPIKRWKH